MAGMTSLEADTAAMSMSLLLQAADALPDLTEGLLEQPTVAPAPSDSSAHAAMDDTEDGAAGGDDDVDAGELAVTSSHGKVAPFVNKLWDVMNDPRVGDVIAWDGEDSFVVLQAERFLRDVLPRVCRSVSFCAFVRQLNGYGFAKTSSKRASFRHRDALFLKDRPDLLPRIMRQGATAKRRHDTSPGPAARGRVRTALNEAVEAPPRARSRRGSKGASGVGATMEDVQEATAALMEHKKTVVRGPRPAPQEPKPAVLQLLSASGTVPPPAAVSPPTTPPPVVDAALELARVRSVALAAISALREITLGTADARAWMNGTARAVVEMAVSTLIHKQEAEMNRTFLAPAAAVHTNGAARLDAALRQLSAAAASGGGAAVEGGSGASVGTRRTRTDSDLMAPVHAPAMNNDRASETSSISAYTQNGEVEGKDAKLAELLGTGFHLAVDGPPSAAAMRTHGMAPAVWAPPPSSFDAAMASFSSSNHGELLRPGGTYGDRFVPFSSSDMDAILRMLVTGPGSTAGVPGPAAPM